MGQADGIQVSAVDGKSVWGGIGRLGLAFGVLCGVHCGIGGFQEAVFRDPIEWIEGHAKTGGSVEDMGFEGEGLEETAFEPPRDLLDFCAGADHGEENGKLIAAEPSEDIERTELAAHTAGDGLEIEVSQVMAVAVVDFLKAIEVDVDEAEGVGGVGARSISLSSWFSREKRL